MRTTSRENIVISVFPVVLAVLLLLLVGHPGGSTMSGRLAVQARARGRAGVGRPPRQQWLTSEAHAHHSDPAAENADDLHALVERARLGDTEAFGALFDHFHGPVYRQLLALTRSRSMAEDLTSETFFKALRAMRQFALPSHLFGPWLRRIARNLANDHFKASRTRLERVAADVSPWTGGAAEGPEDVLLVGLGREQLREALLHLPPNQRRAIALRFLCELSIAETAQALDCTEGAARQLQWRGLRNLARLLPQGVRES
jgi:RNA polymerase sigma-70 factor (ECF subfamily)